MHRSSLRQTKTRKQTKQLSKQTSANQSAGPDGFQSYDFRPICHIPHGFKKNREGKFILLICVLMMLRSGVTDSEAWLWQTGGQIKVLISSCEVGKSQKNVVRAGNTRVEVC